MSIKVTSGGNDDLISVALADYYVGLLGELGYRATRYNLPTDFHGDPRSGAQIGTGYWGVDFAAPSNFWASIVSSSSYRPAGELTYNWSDYCSTEVDSLAKRALALEATDAAAARRLWTEVDNKITDDAPWVFGASTRWTALVSSRIANYQSNPVVGPLIEQMWVQ
jgi:ABC-type transport system substrate-binding protein